MTPVFWRLVAGCTGLATFAVLAVAAAPSETESPPSPAEKYALRYKFRPGETLRWKVVHRARADTTVSDTSKTAESVSTSIKVWRVQKVEPNGAATFEQLVESVDLWQKQTGLAEVRYNSQTDKQPPLLFQETAKSIGVPLSQITIDPLGKILARHGFHKREVQEETLLAIPLPEKPVATGESWTYPFDMQVPLKGGLVKKIQARQSFTLEAVKDGVATIRLATQILTPIDDPAIEVKLVPGEAFGTLSIDLAAGRVVAQQIETDKRVIGFSGKASSLHYRTRFTEELLAQGSQAGEGAKPAAPAAKPATDAAPKSAARSKPADAEARK